ncbi:phage antirepressor [Clostridium saccharobutylicum]|uniref:Putative prophage antirepressor n=1 Tax=Clostridium saccharobutylicum DSM 13864 TaxID=1345695 RepID=U5MMD1_CLOSA|nr:phage antirepressor KilAC domain-containing protein [Clostridium saccharobutylicum]AGX41929.1 putative prophage antirepressor [Clostridium saccharobutylicum DSM 13864]AQR89208.1 phage antirepressor protein KilAC domain protein [Clostridium saccharobutylicum]AQR99109.1 phage antirepressor protein KilAC domain protein [Clostridium saccharobutylicum]AQS08831.1 phage antirepressor protein KilAC domain protein [Clostridium saccharobutylicum]AQS13097.1 phage antirepressor protein KilAC domain pro
MSEIQIFKNPEFGVIRFIEKNGKGLFCGKDIADSLGYDQPHKAVERHCRYGMKCTVPHPQSKDKTIEMIFIPEGDVYRLITHSKLPAAERFEQWVFDEVLPSIRKHGAYITTQKMEEIMNDPDSWIKILTALKAEREEKEQLKVQVTEDKPKVVFADSVSVSDGTILIGELAKILKGNGLDIGQNRLFERLRQEGFLIKRRGTDYNAPTQMAMELGLFKVKETAITHSDGHVTISKTTKVTGKGQQYFINKYLMEGK